MKKNNIRIFITLAAFLILSSASAQKIKSTDKYIAYIQKQQETVVKEFLNYSKALSKPIQKKSAKKIEAIHIKLTSKLNEAQKNIDSLKTSKDDSAYKVSALSYFKECATLLNDDYNKAAGMQKDAGQLYDNMQSFLQAKGEADKKLKITNEHFNEVTVKFATANKLSVDTKNEIDSRMQEMVEADAYYKPIYLLFFKPYGQELDFQNAIQRKDKADFEKYRKDLAKSSQDGQASLDTTKPFKSDNSLVSGCKDALQFYAKEADEKMDPVSDYFSATKDFDEARAAYDKKPTHPKEEIKAYKKQASQFNKAIAKYNKTMSSLYKKKKGVINKWNKTAANFINKHIPKL